MIRVKHGKKGNRIEARTPDYQNASPQIPAASERMFKKSNKFLNLLKQLGY